MPLFFWHFNSLPTIYTTPNLRSLLTQPALHCVTGTKPKVAKKSVDDFGGKKITLKLPLESASLNCIGAIKNPT